NMLQFSKPFTVVAVSGGQLGCPANIVKDQLPLALLVVCRRVEREVRRRKTFAPARKRTWGREGDPTPLGVYPTGEEVLMADGEGPRAPLLLFVKLSPQPASEHGGGPSGELQQLSI